MVFNQVEGDYLEFGVYSGRSFTQSFHAFETAGRSLSGHQSAEGHVEHAYLRNSIRFFAFDSFEGFPAPSGKDLSEKAPVHWQEGDVSMSREEFLEVLRRGGINLDRVFLVEGWYDETLTETTRRELRTDARGHGAHRLRFLRVGDSLSQFHYADGAGWDGYRV